MVRRLGSEAVGDTLEFRYDELFFAEYVNGLINLKVKQLLEKSDSLVLPTKTNLEFEYKGNSDNYSITLRSINREERLIEQSKKTIPYSTRL